MLFRLSPLLLCIIYAQGQDYLGFYPEGLFGDYDGSNNPSFTEDQSKGYGGWDVQDNDDFEKSRGRRYSGLEGDAVEAAISLDEIVPDQDDQLYSQFLNQESPDEGNKGIDINNNNNQSQTWESEITKYTDNIFVEDSVAAAAAENWEQDAASEVTQSNDLENKAEEKKEDVGEKKEGLVEDDKGAKKEDEDGERSKRLTESFWSSELADQDLSNFGLDSLFRKKVSEF